MMSIAEPMDVDPVFVVPEDLAQAFEELSDRFATEVAKECTTQAELAFATADMMDCVAGYVNYALSQAAQEMNQESGRWAVNPPADVFGHVCDYLTLAECITVSHVCQYWRQLAVADARLWNKVVQNYPDSYGARELLERSRTTPVHVEMTVYDTTADAVAIMLSEHLGHIRTLVLRMSDSRTGVVSSAAWTTISYALTRPAPVLETLYMNLAHSGYRAIGPDTSCSLRPDFLAGDAPKLRSVTLGAVSPPPATQGLIEPFAHATSLTYTHHNNGALSSSCLAAVLVHFPRIERFAVSSQQFVDDATDLSLVRPRFLRVIDSTLGQGGEAALRRLNADDVPLVAARQAFQDGGGLPPSPPEHTRTERLSVTLSDASLVAIAEDGTPRDRRFFMLSMHSLRSLLTDATTMRFLQSLLLHEFLWPEREPLPPAPGLRELSVLLASTAEHRSWSQGVGGPHMMMPGFGFGGGMGGGDEAQGTLTLFQLPHELPAPWNCASLRKFRLVFNPNKAQIQDSDAGPRVVSAADVLTFVETHLAAALPLASISLHGVELLEATHDVPAFNGLLSLCTEFIVRPLGDNEDIETPQPTGMWDAFAAYAGSPDHRRRRL